MSQRSEPITQHECRQRLINAIVGADASMRMTALDRGQWIAALLSTAAFLGDVPLERNLPFVEAAADLMLRFKQDTAGRTPGG